MVADTMDTDTGRPQNRQLQSLPAHRTMNYVFSTGVIDNASIDKDCYKQMVIIYSFFNEFLPFPEKHQGYVTPLMALTREGEGIEEAEFSRIWSQQHTENMNETDC